MGYFQLLSFHPQLKQSLICTVFRTLIVGNDRIVIGTDTQVYTYISLSPTVSHNTLVNVKTTGLKSLLTPNTKNCSKILKEKTMLYGLYIVHSDNSRMHRTELVWGQQRISSENRH